VRSIEPDHISLLYFDDAKTSPTLNAQHVDSDFREATLLIGRGEGGCRGHNKIYRRNLENLSDASSKRLSVEMTKDAVTPMDIERHLPFLRKLCEGRAGYWRCASVFTPNCLYFLWHQ
jgi:hypothetical protein